MTATPATPAAPAVGDPWLTDVDWTVKSDDTVDPLLVRVPGGTRELHKATLPKYLKLRIERRRVPLVLKTVDTGSGDQERAVTVATDHRVEQGAPVDLVVASRGQHIRWRSLHHRDGRFDLAAGVCSLLAVLLAGSLTIGRYAVLIPMSSDALAGVQAAAVLFAAAAAVLLLVKSMGAAPPGS